MRPANKWIIDNYVTFFISSQVDEVSDWQVCQVKLTFGLIAVGLMAA